MTSKMFLDIVGVITASKLSILSTFQGGAPGAPPMSSRVNGLWSCCVEPADLQWNTLLTCKLSGAIIYLGLIYPSYACKNLTICKNADIVFLHSLALCNSPVLGYNREHLWCKITRKSCSKMRWILEKFSNNN